MNETISTKYQLPPETIEKRSLNPNDGKYFQEVYHFMRIKKIEDNQMRNDKHDQKIDRRKRTLRDSLNLDEKDLVLGERIKKKDAPGNLYKTSTDNIRFFNRDHIFTIYKRAKLENGTYLQWVENNVNYYTASLDCNLILKEEINKDKKQEIEELSKKIRLLSEKGHLVAYQNDIGWLTLKNTHYYNFSRFGVTYNFITYPNIFDENCYKYKFYDTVDKKIKDCKIYSPFLHFKGNGFEFKRILGPKKMIQFWLVFLIIIKKLKPHLYIILMT